MVAHTFRKPMVELTFRKPNKHSKSITNWHLLSENPELSFASQLGWPTYGLTLGLALGLL